MLLKTYECNRKVFNRSPGSIIVMEEEDDQSSGIRTFWIIFIIVVVGMWIFFRVIPDSFQAQNNSSSQYHAQQAQGLIYNGYPIKHYDHMPLSYVVVNKNQCSQYSLNQLSWAMNIITNASNNLITFEESDDKYGSDIMVTCIDFQGEFAKLPLLCKNLTFEGYKDSLKNNETQLDPANELLVKVHGIQSNDNGSIFEVCYKNINGSALENIPVNLLDAVGLGWNEWEGDIISHGYVYLNQGTVIRCVDLPEVELHELLHAFSFAHNYEIDELEHMSDTRAGLAEMDIMSPYVKCALQHKLDDKYAACLQYIYSGGKQGICKDVKFW